MRVSCNQPMKTVYAMIDFESGKRRKRLQAATGEELVKEPLVARKSSLSCIKSAKSWAG